MSPMLYLAVDQMFRHESARATVRSSIVLRSLLWAFREERIAKGDIQTQTPMVLNSMQNQQSHFPFYNQVITILRKHDVVVLVTVHDRVQVELLVTPRTCHMCPSKAKKDVTDYEKAKKDVADYEKKAKRASFDQCRDDADYLAEEEAMILAAEKKEEDEGGSKLLGAE